MTTGIVQPITYLDPTGGGDYPFGGRFPSAHASQILRNQRSTRIAALSDWKKLVYPATQVRGVVVGYSATYLPITLILSDTGSALAAAVIGTAFTQNDMVDASLYGAPGTSIGLSYPVRVQAGSSPGVLYPTSTLGYSLHQQAGTILGVAAAQSVPSVSSAVPCIHGVSYACDTGNAKAGAILVFSDVSSSRSIVGIPDYGNSVAATQVTVSGSALKSVAVNGCEYYKTGQPIATTFAAVNDDTIFTGSLPLAAGGVSTINPNIGVMQGIRFCCATSRWIIWSSTGVYTATAPIGPWVQVLDFGFLGGASPNTTDISFGSSQAGVWIAGMPMPRIGTMYKWRYSTAMFVSADMGATWQPVAVIPDYVTPPYASPNSQHIDYFAGQFRFATTNGVWFSQRFEN